MSLIERRMRRDCRACGGTGYIGSGYENDTCPVCKGYGDVAPQTDEHPHRCGACGGEWWCDKDTPDVGDGVCAEQHWKKHPTNEECKR